MASSFLSGVAHDARPGEGGDASRVRRKERRIRNSFFKQIAQEVANSQWIAIAIDQLLGPGTGRVFNDASADIAAGKITPEQAASAVEKSWQQNKQ